MEYQIISLESGYEQFDEYIDEATEEVKILGLTYTPSQVLKEIDPTAYRVIFSEFTDHLYEQGIAIEEWNDELLIECENCGIFTEDFRDTYCYDCDKQEHADGNGEEE